MRGEEEEEKKIPRQHLDYLSQFNLAIKIIQVHQLVHFSSKDHA